MDKNEWNLESSSRNMGTDLRDVTENLRLLYNPKTTRGDPHLHSYESYPSGDKEEVKN
jgi:hypothetical protein